MFTGIITNVGVVRSVEPRADTRFVIKTGWRTEEIALGASIACSGVCLTVVDRAEDWFAVDVSAESLSRTGLGGWGEGTRINLERALRMGDELGGHIVSGHVDGIATLVSVKPENGSHRLVLEVPKTLAPFIAEKGSVTLDGISLTVNEVDGARFGVNIIPHTWEQTTLGDRVEGDRLHLEVDMLARYVARLAQFEGYVAVPTAASA